MLMRSRDGQDATQKSLWEALQCGSSELPAIARSLSICLQVVAGLREKRVILFPTWVFLKYVIQYVILTERLLRTYYRYALTLYRFVGTARILFVFSAPANIQLTGPRASGSKHFYILCWLTV